MSTYTISGPSNLTGTVSVQGAKNSAMKHVLMPLLVSGLFTLKNMPHISSITNLLELVSLFGPTVKWLDSNTVQIDSTSSLKLATISSELFYHTSGAVFLIPILVNHFGQCKIEFSKTRNDTGGDQIGRTMDVYDQFLLQIGVTKTVTSSHWVYQSSNTNSFNVDVKDSSFGLSVMLLIAALARHGQSRLNNITNAANFYDTLRILKLMGAKIDQDGSSLLITGSQSLHPVEFTNMGDQHDFATYVSLALTTQSSITINGYDFDQMKLQPLVDLFDQLGIQNHNLNNQSTSFVVPKIDIKKLQPVKIIAADFPKFITEWQVLFSPLFAQIPGQSQIVEGWFFDRMRHWFELAKMGAQYEYISVPEFPEKDSAPRAVNVTGINEFVGAKVLGKDLRSTACLIIAGLSARGQTQVSDPDDHLSRGYESFITNLSSLGANISIST